MNYSLKSRQISFFFLAFLPVTKLFMMPSVIAKYAAEDMWISVLINLLLDFFTMFGFIILLKKENVTYFELLNRVYGKTLSKIILFSYVLFFMLKVVVPINELKDYVVKTLYITSPDANVFFPIFIVFIYFALKKLRVVGRCSDIMWLFTFVGLILIFCLSLPNVDLEALLPVGATGIKGILGGSYSALGWFGDCVYFLFFIGEYRQEKGSALKILSGYALSLISVLVFALLFWCTFSSIAYRQKFALTEISKYMTIINNIGRFDYIGIFFVMFSDVFALGLPVYFSSLILRKIFPLKKAFIYPLVLTVLQLVSILFFGQYYYTIEKTVIRYIGVLCLFYCYLFPLFSMAVYKIINKERKNELQNG